MTHFSFLWKSQVMLTMKGKVFYLDKLKVTWCPILTIDSEPVFQKPHTLKVCQEKFECLKKKAQ